MGLYILVENQILLKAFTSYSILNQKLTFDVYRF